MYDITGVYQAQSVRDAIRALEENPAAALIAGGTDVLIKVREGKLAGAMLVSIHGMDALTGVRMAQTGEIVIGPCTALAEIAADPVIRRHAPLLAEAADQVGGPQIRNMGTIGGNIANGATSADTAAPLLALEAVLELTGAKGVRRVPARQFYIGPGKTVRAHDEVLTAIRIAAADYAGFGGCYLKYGKREAMEIATLGCAVAVRLDHGCIGEIRLAYGVAAPTPIRCPNCEAYAAGRAVEPGLAEELAGRVLREVQPRTSWRASKQLRLQLVEEMTKRAFREAVRRAGGERLC